VQKQVIKWLNEEERKIFSARIRKTHGFVNCVGLIDGTLFPLAFIPTLNVEDYFTRKGNYAFKGLFIFDDAAKITWIEMGWPSSVHNNQVWSNSDVYLSKDKYFNNKEYLLDDSAFSVSLVMVPAFKKGHNPDSKERKYFNTKLAKVRIKNEHCIGLWDLWYNISTLNLRHSFSNFKRSFSTFKCTHSLSAYVYPLAPEIVVVTSYQSINQSSLPWT